MPTYRYTAVDRSGLPVSGELEAATPEAALAELAARGLDAASITVVQVARLPRGQGWLSTPEAVEMARGLADLANARLPLADGLRALAGELAGWRLPRVLREMSGQLEAGTPLDAVIQAQGPRFPVHVRGLVLAGLRSGRLAEVLEEFVDLQRGWQELRRRVSLSLAYPLVLMFVVGPLLILFPTILTPAFQEVYADFGLELPVVTKLVLYVTGPSMLVLGIALLWLVGGGLVLAVMPTVGWVQPVLCRIPLIGPLWRYGRLVQFGRLMGTLLEQEVPLPEALKLTAAGLRDARLAAGCRRVAGQVESGLPLAESLAANRQFPPSMIPLVEWGQRSQAMADAFRAAAEMFEGRVQTQGLFLEAVVLPVTLMLGTFLIGFMVIGLMMPMISLVQALT